jgi:FG-GAP-like repeat
MVFARTSRMLVGLVGLAAAAQGQEVFGIEREMVPASAGPLQGAADFDGDGDVDLLTVMTGIYVNDGNGRFSPHPVLSPIWSYVAMVIADFNGDGLPDVIAGNLAWVNVGGVLVQQNGLLPALSAGPPIRCLAAGDVDGDGDRDLVIGRAGAPLVFLKNLGPMLFVDASSQLPPSVLFPRKMELIDLDGDGDRDLLMSNDSVSNPAPSANRIIMTNGGTGVFSIGTPGILGTGNPSETFTTGDVNGDLLPDIAMHSFGSITLLVNLGGGGYVATTLGITGVPLLLDVTGDGSDEMVLTNTLPGVEIRTVLPGPAISPPFQTLAIFSVGGAFAADFDGDGDRDLVIPTTSAHRLSLNTGQGLAEIPGYLSTPGYSTPGLQPGDIDGDGDVDLIGMQGQSIVIARNDGNGQLDWQGTAPCTGPCPIVTPDVVFRPFDADGDGDLDLYVVNGWATLPPAPPGDRLLLNTGSGFTAAVGWYAWGTVGRAIARGDLDGDGDDDLVVSRLGPGPTPMPAQVFLSLGGGTLSAPMAVPATSWTGDVALVDVDGDGDLDLVEANYYPGTGATSMLFLNAGAGAFTPAAGFPAVPAATVRTGDLDGDGDPDLLLDGQVLLNGGNGTFTPGVNLLLPGFSYFALQPELLDANADGLLDVLHDGRVHLNTGAGTFASPITLATYPSGGWAAVADFDRDGDHDVVIPAGYPRLYSGLSRQLSRGLPARPGRPASFDLHGPALGTWTLFASTGPAVLPLPPYGTVWIDPAPAVAIGNGSFDAAGRGAWSAVVPTSPSFVGQSFFLQAVVFGGAVPKLTGREIATVATY